MPRPNGAAIKAIREAQGWKVNRLADAAGISRPHLSNLERNEPGKTASAAVLRRLADVLGVPYAALTSTFTVDQIAGEEAGKQDCPCGRVA